ncbi:MAG TPA: septal ring lytic transglycosylase RlpA family protein, partial [Usitatibacter sp.]|nr:septal ring lytic transglycosylase RlpA family protein [Usitatibacter sp.]
SRDLAPITIAEEGSAFAQPPLRTTLRISRRRLNVLEGHPARVSGTLLENGLSAQAGLMVVLERRAARGWSGVSHARTHSGGRFSISYLAESPRSEMVRVRFPGDALAHSSTRHVGRLNVYQLAGASWYGGGGPLACGGELTSSTLGVANRTLPCGTLVTLRYGGHTVRVPVIDRGPFVAGREFDLTEATKRALGFGSTGDVWSTA